MITMKYYTSSTEFNCGIDLHARQMYVCVMDRQGKKRVHTNVKDNDFSFFLKLVEPYKHDLTVCCECMFGWYWLADACQAAGLTFVLAHALYVKAIHGGKNKNDRIDSEKLTHLLRSNLIPPAYVYPADKRPLRALLRQRIFYVWRRAELLARIHSHQLAHNRLPARQTRRTRDPWEEQLLGAEDNPLRQIALKNDLAMIRHFDQQIFALEEELQRQTKKVASRDYALLQSVPGIGENLGLTILYEIGDINRSSMAAADPAGSFAQGSGGRAVGVGDGGVDSNFFDKHPHSESRCVRRSALNVERWTLSVEHPTSNAQHRTLNVARAMRRGRARCGRHSALTGFWNSRHSRYSRIETGGWEAAGTCTLEACATRRALHDSWIRGIRVIRGSNRRGTRVKEVWLPQSQLLGMRRG